MIEDTVYCYVLLFFKVLLFLALFTALVLSSTSDQEVAQTWEAAAIYHCKASGTCT